VIFVEFILWVADVVERENNSGGTALESAVKAYNDNHIDLDAMSGGIKLELQWSKFKPALSLIDAKALSRDEFGKVKKRGVKVYAP
jgi:hypothetical protein